MKRPSVTAIVYHSGVTTTNGKAPAPVQLRRRYGVEKDWMPLLVKMGHTKLRYGFIACGVSPSVASGLVFFLEDQITLSRHQNTHTRTAYRKALAPLDPEEIEAAADKFVSDNPPIMHTLREAA